MPGSTNNGNRQHDYNDDADFALALQLQFENENEIANTAANDLAFADPGRHESNAKSVTTPSSPSHTSSLAGKNAISHHHQPTDPKKFQSVTEFMQFVKNSRCRNCNNTLFRSGLDVKALRSWKGGPATLSSLIKCRSCSSTACVACTSTSLAKISSVNITGKKISWCCDTGRLLLIWLLLCAFDETFTAKKLQDIKANKATPAHSRSTKGQGGHYNPVVQDVGMGMFHRGTSAMPKGMGFGGDGHGYHYAPSPMHIYGAGQRLDGASNTNNQTPVSKVQRDEDQSNALYLELLERLFPSFERGSTFDFQPPALVADLLLESKILKYCAELLRNDSVEDATKRKIVYQALINFLRTLGAHPATANSTLYSERPLKDDKINLLDSTFGNIIPSVKEKGVALFDILKSLSMQSTLVLQNARRNEKEFHNQDGQDLLLVCRTISDLYRYLEANAGISRSVPGGLTAKDIPALDSVADGMILETHQFAQAARALNTSLPGRTKRLITEITKLQTGLPPGIYVRHAESRLDVQKWIVIGPADTPYENGIFEFDVFCDYSFPNKPPMVHFKTTGGGRVNFNPNLYPDGKVCLSLLGTWQGEPWVPAQSTLLQVLISIQGLILCEEPWYNEPGRESTYRKGGSGPSASYNQTLQRETVRHAILGWADRSPSLWKDAVDHHFRENANKILQTAEKWLRAKDLLPLPGGHGIGSTGVSFDDMMLLPGQSMPPQFGRGIRQNEGPEELLARLQKALAKYGAAYVIKDVPKISLKDSTTVQPPRSGSQAPGAMLASPAGNTFTFPQSPQPFSSYLPSGYVGPYFGPPGMSPLSGQGNALGGAGSPPGVASQFTTISPYGRGGHTLRGSPAGRGGFGGFSQPAGTLYPSGPEQPDYSAMRGRGGYGQGGRGTPSTRGRGSHGGPNPWS